MRKFIKKFKNSILGKLLKFVFNIIRWAIELFIIGIAIVILTQRLTNNTKSFLGFRIFDVATGSMEPEYVVGDILIAKEQDPSTIKVGDNIVYLGNQGDYKNKIITHNVIQIEQNEKGEYLFHTKGIANTVEDPIVHEEQLYGTVVENNVVLAWICKILTNQYGLYFLVILPIILYAFIGFVKAQGEKMEQERLEEIERRKREHEKREQRKKVREAREKRENEVVELEEINETVKTEKEDNKINEVVKKAKKESKTSETAKKTTKSSEAKTEKGTKHLIRQKREKLLKHLIKLKQRKSLEK